MSLVTELDAGGVYHEPSIHELVAITERTKSKVILSCDTKL